MKFPKKETEQSEAKLITKTNSPKVDIYKFSKTSRNFTAKDYITVLKLLTGLNIAIHSPDNYITSTSTKKYIETLKDDSANAIFRNFLIENIENKNTRNKYISVYEGEELGTIFTIDDRTNIAVKLMTEGSFSYFVNAMHECHLNLLDIVYDFMNSEYTEEIYEKFITTLNTESMKVISNETPAKLSLMKKLRNMFKSENRAKKTYNARYTHLKLEDLISRSIKETNNRLERTEKRVADLDNEKPLMPNIAAIKEDIAHNKAKLLKFKASLILIHKLLQKDSENTTEIQKTKIDSNIDPEKLRNEDTSTDEKSENKTKRRSTSA